MTTTASSVLLHALLLSVARQKHSPDTASYFKDEYDYVVVGAGSAGSTVAARLSEEPCVSVLLLEAGNAPPLISEVPALARNLWFSEIDWKYKTVPQKHTGNGLDNKQVYWPSGKALGGSSTLNAMLYVRGNHKNYDDWAALGADGWSYKDVLPYFLKLENNTDPAFLANGYHRAGGPMSFEKPHYISEIKKPILQSALHMGYKYIDTNGANQTGFSDFQANLRDSQRCSTAKAYLVPAESRSNLDILPDAQARKIIIENNRAVGVEFDFDGATRTVKAKKEVILSSGTINSAQILMLSGVGPKDHLEKMKIPVIADLPVGNNLQDHCATTMNYALPLEIPKASAKSNDPKNIHEYINHRTGPLSSPEYISMISFLHGLDVHPKVDFPTFELFFVEGTTEVPAKRHFNLKKEVFDQVYMPYQNRSFFFCLPQLLQPRSHGTVRLNSADPYDPPLIDPNYFAHPKDLDEMVEGMKFCRIITKQKPMVDLGVKAFDTMYPGCEKYADDEDKYLRCQARSVVVTVSHQVGTARMGHPSDPKAVVDPQLRVKGINGLRVVDASVMPKVTSGNTNIPTIMVAEKAADIIKKDINCSSK